MTVGFVYIFNYLVMYLKHSHTFHSEETIAIFNVYVDALFIFLHLYHQHYVVFVVCIALYGMCTMLFSNTT